MDDDAGGPQAAEQRDSLPRFAPDSRRALILAAARAEFIDRGPAAARTREIAKAAGVSEGLVFKHFNSKDALFKAAVLEPLQVVAREMLDAAETLGAVGAAEQEEQWETFQRHFLEAMSDVAPLIGPAVFADRQRGQQFFVEHIWPLIAAMRDALDRAMDSTSVSRHDPKIVAIALSGAYFGYGIADQFGEERLDAAEFARVMTSMILHGLTPPS